MAEKLISVDRMETVLSLFGNYDENVNLIQKEYNVVILGRGDDIKITGDEENVFNASEAINSLIALINKGEAITEQTIRYVFTLVREGKQYEIKHMSDDGVCVTVSGKLVKPKTLGQKRYVEAIRKKTIVMGIGPAGTGKTYLAVAMAVKAYTEPGDYILIQDPVYYPFREVIESNDRKVAANILIRKEDGSYAIDFEDFERQIVEKGVKLFLFCSPHNPVSRVWTREEVERLGDICLKHQVIIVSDEIHADFVFEGKHQVLVDLKDEYKDITVTCTSPGKTFNLAGLQISNIIIPNAGLRKEFQHQVTAAGYSQVGAPGIFALIAAYTQGEEWYQAMKQYVKSNIDFLHTWMAEHLPQIKVTKTEGTYLVWMDFRALGLSDKELKELIEDKAEVWLDGGAIFGEPGSGFERINVACQRATLVEALDRIEKAVKENVHG